VPRYLTPEWVEAAQRAVDGDPTVAVGAKGVHVIIQHVVTGGPGGDATYHVIIEDGSVRIVHGETSKATATFEQDWETAVAVTRGELSAQAAFMTGRIRVRGDLPKLIEYGNLFGDVGDVFAGVRSSTTY
jgi:putative sterol carrier protein